MPIRYGRIWILRKEGHAVRQKRRLRRLESGAPLEMEYKSRKIDLPKETKEGDAFPVRRYHIDTNEHVNNCRLCSDGIGDDPGRQQDKGTACGIQEVGSSRGCDLSESGDGRRPDGSGALRRRRKFLRGGRTYKEE